MSARRRPGLAALAGQALASLAGHPLRSTLTALSVAFGAAVLYILLAYATGVPDTTADLLRSMGSKEFLVEARRAHGPAASRGRQVRIRYADLPAIRDACPSIGGLAASYSPGRGGPVFAADKSWPWARTNGVGYEYRAVTDLRIVSGRWFTPEEEHEAVEVALLSRPLVEGMFDGRSPIGEPVTANGRRFEVIGVFESKGTFAYTLLVPYPTAMDMGEDGGRHVSQIAFTPLRPDLAQDAIAEIRTALQTLYSVDPADTRAFDVTENTAFVAKVQAVSLGLEGLVLTIAAIALVLGCLGAANVVGISVAERTPEIGLRKALGATSARVRAEVLAETLLLCLVGGALGVLLGTAAAAGLGPLHFTDQASLVPRADRSLLTVSFAVLVITATLAGLPAANRAARLQPATALHDE